MAHSGQEYFILRNHVPIGKTNNFFKNWLLAQTADHVLQGELLVREAQPQDGSHAVYSLALDRTKKVSCSNSDVIPLSENDYEWLAAIGKPIDCWYVYFQQDKFKAIKKLQVDERVWVCLPASDGKPSELTGSSCCHATVKYIGPLQGMPGRWVGVELKVRQSVHYSCKSIQPIASASQSHVCCVHSGTAVPCYASKLKCTVADLAHSSFALCNYKSVQPPYCREGSKLLSLLLAICNKHCRQQSCLLLL